MPVSREELLAEAYRRNRLPPAQRVAYEEAVRRGRVRDSYATGRIESRGMGQIGAAASTLNEAIPLADEAGAAMSVVADFLTGNDRNVGRAWGRARSRQDGQRDELRTINRPASDLATGVGYAVQALPAFATGGATVAPQAGGAAARATTRPVSRAVGNVLAPVGRSAAVGGAYAGANALAGRGDAGARLQSALAAVGPGMATGGAFPVAAAGGRAILGGASGVARAAGRTVTRSLNNATGGRMLNPQNEAQQMVVRAMRADRLTPTQMREALSEWQRVGGPSPAFMDIVNAGGRGQQTMALFRRSASVGAGRTEAVKYQNRVGADLQDNALDRTRALTPDDARTGPGIQTNAQGRIDAALAPPTTVQPGVGGAQVSSALNTQRDEALAGVNAAYDRARAANAQQALIPRAEVPRLSNNLEEGVMEFDPARVPSVYREVARFQNLTDVTAEDLFRSRSILTRLAGSSDNVEAAAARQARVTLDREIDRLESTMTGNPQAVQAWRAANTTRREFGTRFEGEDLTQRLVARDRHGAGTTNTLAPEDASNAVLGRNGVLPRQDLTRDLTRIRETLGADSPQWAALSNEATDRLAANGPDGLLGFAQANPELARVLIPPARLEQAVAGRQAIAGAEGELGALRVGGGGLRTPSSQFSQEFGALPDNADIARVGYRQSLTDAIEAPTAEATGVLNRISSSTRQGNNLTTAFGEQPARDYQQAVGNIVDQVSNARFINPNTGSQSGGRLFDNGLVDGGTLPYPSAYGLATAALRKLVSGATLSDAEREAIMRMATSTDHVRWDSVLGDLAAPTQRGGPGFLGYAAPILAREQSARIGQGQ